MASRSRPEPLQGHPKYEKIKDLNSGTFGFVQLCKNKLDNTDVAIKFIERGDKASGGLTPCRGLSPH